MSNGSYGSDSGRQSSFSITTGSPLVVIWTRHRLGPDLTPVIRRWFAESGFLEVAFDSAEDRAFGVGTVRLAAAPRPFVPGRTLFDFRGDGTGAFR